MLDFDALKTLRITSFLAAATVMGSPATAQETRGLAGNALVQTRVPSEPRLRFLVHARLANQREWFLLEPGGTLTSGDRIAFEVTVFEPTYVYIFQRNETGAPLLFPPKGHRKVRPGVPVRFPDRGQSFKLDRIPGEEKVYLVASDAPIPRARKGLGAIRDALMKKPKGFGVIRDAVKKANAKPKSPGKVDTQRNPKTAPKNQNPHVNGKQDRSETPPPSLPASNDTPPTMKKPPGLAVLTRGLVLVQDDNSVEVSPEDESGLIVYTFEFDHRP